MLLVYLLWLIHLYKSQHLYIRKLSVNSETDPHWLYWLWCPWRGWPCRMLSYGRPKMGLSYGQPKMGLSYGQPKMGLSYGQPKMGLSYGQPKMGLSYGQPMCFLAWQLYCHSDSFCSQYYFLGIRSALRPSYWTVTVLAVLPTSYFVINVGCGESASKSFFLFKA